MAVAALCSPQDHTALTEFPENSALGHFCPQRGKEVRAGFIRPILLMKKLRPEEELYLAGSGSRTLSSTLSYPPFPP